MADTCTHLDTVADVAPSDDGCHECLQIGGRWVHLRMCRSCGHVGCCDDSPARHARVHSSTATHALVSSYEPGEDWWWCFVDEVGFTVPDLPTFSHP